MTNPRDLNKKSNLKLNSIGLTGVNLIAILCWVLFTYFYIKDKNIQRKHYYNSHTESSAYELTSGILPWKCAEVRSCSCRDTTVNNKCRDLVGNLTSGECDNGYHCCSRRCETCYRRCAVHCTDSKGKTYTCGYRQCHPYDCNCQCSNSVNNRKCYSYVSNCYTGYREYIVIPAEKLHRVEKCTLSLADCVQRVDRFNFQANTTKNCTIDDRECAVKYSQNSFQGDRLVPIHYKTNNMQQWKLGTIPNFKYDINDGDYRKSLISLAFFGSLLTVISFVYLCIILCVYC